MTKYYIEFKEKQIWTYGYYEEANSPEEAFELAEDKYCNDVPSDSLDQLDYHYFEHKVEEA